MLASYSTASDDSGGGGVATNSTMETTARGRMRSVEEQDGGGAASQTLITCGECHAADVPADSWWCRDCVKTICKRCNLVNNHTSHRSVPWTREELLAGCAQALESRCSRRTQTAADDEIAVTEFIAQVESCMLEEIKQNLERENTIDRQKIAAISRLVNVNNLVYYVPDQKVPAWKLGSDDRRIEALLREAARVTNMSAFLEPSRSNSGRSAGTPHGSPRLAPPPPMSREPRSFAILNDLSLDRKTSKVQEVAAWLFEKVEAMANQTTPDTDTTVTVSGSVGRPIVDSGFHSHNGDMHDGDATDGSFLRSSSTPLGYVEAARPSSEFHFPLEPQVRIATRPAQDSRQEQIQHLGIAPIESEHGLKPPQQSAYHRYSNDDSLPLMDHFSMTGDRTTDSYKDMDTSRSGAVTASSSITDTAEGSSSYHNAQTLPLGGRRTPCYSTTTQTDLAPSQSKRIYTNGSMGDSSGDDGGVPPPPRVRSVAMPAEEPNPLLLASAEARDTGVAPEIDSFHFGFGYLTRPIDVCVLPGTRSEQLAISDSCNGVFITDQRGNVWHQLNTDGGSASSLCYNPIRNHLLVSVLKKDGRSLYAFNVATWERQQVLKCPKQPSIELTRTRWIACATKRDNCAGELFLCSGDNKRSAVWVYANNVGKWQVVLDRPQSRFQYLQVAEEHPENGSLVLMLCEPINNAILLLVVGKGGDVLSEYDLFSRHQLARFVRSPGSAIVDEGNNLIVLDYTKGDIWVVIEGNKRTIRRLGNVGGQQGLGMALSGNWLFVACFTKRRIEAIRVCLQPTTAALTQTQSAEEPLESAC